MIIIRSLIITILLSVSVFCQGQANKKLLSHVPKESFWITSFDIPYTRSKIDVDRIKALPMLQEAITNVKKMARGDSSIVEVLWDDPNSFGVDIEEGCVSFLDIRDFIGMTPQVYGGYMFQISSKAKFQSLVKAILKEGYAKVEKGKGYSFLQKNSTSVAWNGKYFMFVAGNISGADLQTQVEILFKMKKKSSVLTNDNFTQHTGSQEDLLMWVNFERYMEAMQQNLNTMESLAKDAVFFQLFKDMKSMYQMSYASKLNFKNGQIELKTDQVNESNSLYAKFYDKTINPNVLNYIDENELIGIVSGAVSTRSIREFYDEKFGSLKDTLELLMKREIAENESEKLDRLKALDEILKEDSIMTWQERLAFKDSIEIIQDSLVETLLPKMDEHIDSTLNVFGMTREDMWSIWGGDFVLASTGTYQVVDTFQTYDYIENEDGEFVYDQIEKTELVKRPLFKAIVSTNIPFKVSYALDKFDSIGLITKKDHYYYSSFEEQPYFITVTPDSLVLISNDSAFIANLPNNNWVVKQRLAELSELILAKPMFAYVHCNKLLDALESPEESEPYLGIIRDYLVDSKYFLEIDPQTKKMSAPFTLNFVNSDDNSFHLNMDMFNLLYLEFKKDATF